MPFLLPNQQHQSTEGSQSTANDKKISFGSFCCENASNVICTRADAGAAV